MTFAINQASLAVTPNSGQNKVYGTNDPTLSYTQTGLVNGVMVDGVTINDSLSGALTRVGYGTQLGENVGNYAITQGTLAATSNYSLSFTPGVSFAINQAKLAVTPDSGQNKVYGNKDPILTYTQTGLVNGVTIDGGVAINDSLNGALTRVGFGTPAGENVGNYAITQGTLAASSNYSLSFTPGVNFAITPAILTLNGTKTYELDERVCGVDLRGRRHDLNRDQRPNAGGDRPGLGGEQQCDRRDANVDVGLANADQRHRPRQQLPDCG